MDCKVIPGESLTTQHRVMVMDVRVKRRARRRNHSGPPRIKWWHLKGVKQRIFQHKILEEVSGNHMEALMICGRGWHMRLKR